MQLVSDKFIVIWNMGSRTGNSTDMLEFVFCFRYPWDCSHDLKVAKYREVATAQQSLTESFDQL